MPTIPSADGSSVRRKVEWTTITLLDRHDQTLLIQGSDSQLSGHSQEDKDDEDSDEELWVLEPLAGCSGLGDAESAGARCQKLGGVYALGSADRAPPAELESLLAEAPP